MIKKAPEYSRKDLESNQSLIKNLGLHKRSITPTTLDKIVFDNSEDDLYYKEHYKYKDNEVMRYGINASNIKVDLERSLILGESINLIDTTKQIDKSVKSNQYKLEDAKLVKHHTLEIHLLQQAINHLLNNETNNKTVLVSIFARENGAIKILKNGYTETHTVVLYKNPPIESQYEISVIDPSNFLFSSHLVNLNGVLKHEEFSKITTMHKGLQIYRPISENVGSDNNQYRDCIDIAVKLAFGFNKMQWSQLNFEGIKNFDIVKVISNNSDINKSMQDDMYTKQFIKIPLRIQQKSNIKIEEDFYKFSKTIKENLTNIVRKDVLEEAFIKYVINSDKNSNIDTLFQLHSICKDTFLQIHRELVEQETEILGKDFDKELYYSEDF